MKIFVIILFLLIVQLSLFAQQANNSENGANNYFVTLGYWNDNFLVGNEINKYLKRKIFQDVDDFITTSFWMRVSFGGSNENWFIDNYLNIITNKKRHFRTDLYTIRVMHKNNYENGSMSFGGGIVSNGNYGGKRIQDLYHKSFSIQKVVMPYTQYNYLGLGLFASAKHLLTKYEQLNLFGSSSLSLLTGIGPSFWQLGFTSVYNASSEIISMQFHSGYLHYYKNPGIFKYFFDKGFIWGYITSIKVYKGFQLSVWVTGNQYGVGSQNHFGMSLTIGSDKLIPVNFDDIKYP
ncbi:MAG: hypothetical protein KJ799_14290 [Bacteroidetes bacterium]|nr:hypothetical protein [Bacteroidota bacterium]MBU1678196.1 hypothetical protein [Bacteroidota bacterium]MBU2507874.1 hypothetical protein [Bacteroidota bacterium]